MAFHQYYNLRFDKALEFLDRAIVINPTMAEAYMQKMDFLYNVAKYYNMKGNRIKAVDALNGLRNVKEEMIEKNRKLQRPI